MAVFEEIQSERVRGRVLVGLSVLAFSTAGIITKSVQAGGWEIIFWRGVASIVAIFLVLLLSGRLRAECAHFGAPGWLIALLNAAGTAAFIPAFKFTSVAHVALIYATVPLVSAGLAFVLIGERATGRVLVASLLSCIGVGVIVSGGTGMASLRGDMLALFMTVMLGGIMVAYRVWPGTGASLPVLVSCVMLLPVAGALGAPLRVAPLEIAALLGFGLLFSVAAVTLAAGAKHLPASETALLSMLETPLAPLLAWVLLGEQMSAALLTGGALIMGAVLWSQR